jgi:hypothetical protein
MDNNSPKVSEFLPFLDEVCFLCGIKVNRAKASMNLYKLLKKQLNQPKNPVPEMEYNEEDYAMPISMLREFHLASEICIISGINPNKRENFVFVLTKLRVAEEQAKSNMKGIFLN